jgi:hypothetical protein
MIREYGDWQQAKLLLEGLSEPKLTQEAQYEKHLNIDTPDILGYPCQYTRHKLKNGIKAFVTLMNPTTSSCYIKNFSEVTSKEADYIFN